MSAVAGSSSEPELSAGEQAGQRAARNTVARASGEILGKLASLVLFGAMGRVLGPSDLGVFVFAFAYVQVAMLPIELGFDRMLLRRVAADKTVVDRLVGNVIILKGLLLGPAAAIGLGIVWALGYGTTTQVAVAVLIAGFVFDTLARTLFGVFMAYERSELLALSVVVQRVAAAALGLAALALGFGVVAVAITYTVGSALGVVVALVLLRRHIGLPRRQVDRAQWGAIVRASGAFAVQDVLTLLLFKLDAVILSVMASDAAVGRYGSAYRLFESTWFVSVALIGAVSAMYTYLGRNTEPTVASVFSRSVKLALVALVPCAVAFGLLAEPLSRLFFGGGLVGAAAPLRLLAPIVVLLGIAGLCSSLLMSRGDPRRVVGASGVVVVLNIVLNVVLIRSMDERGAALAMLLTEVVLVAIVLPLAAREVGGVRWVAIAAGPAAAGAAMAGVMVAVGGGLLSLVPGTAAFVLVLALVERRTSPAALEYVRAMVRRRLPGGAAPASG